MNLVVTLLLIFNSFSTWALTCDVGNDVMSDHLKIEAIINPKLTREFCWAVQTCQGFRHKPVMPSDYNCPEGFDRPYAKRLGEIMACPLNQEEAIAIFNYTLNSSECLNAYLRQQEVKSESLNYFVNRLNNTLDKLPSYEGFVIRGTNLPAEIKALHTKGSTVTYDSFTSASTKDKEKSWGKQTFLIFSKTGKPIMNLSMAPSEYEVLFKSGTKFKVLEISGKPDSEFYVMKEVSETVTSEEEAKEDASILQKIKERKNEYRLPDEWFCSPPEMKKKIYQDRMPDFNN